MRNKNIVLLVIFFGSRLAFSKDLPSIQLTREIERWVNIQTQQTTSINIRYFFTLNDKTHNFEKVSFLGKNIGNYIEKVPASKKEFLGYGSLKMASVFMILGGVATAITTTSLQFTEDKKNEQGEFDPPNFTGPAIGLGIAVSAWIPSLIANVKLRKSVNIYNNGRL